MGVELVRFPMEPFESLFRATYGKCTERTIALRSGVSTRTVQLGRRHGVSFGVADRLAASIDEHPLQIWPDAYDRLDERAARTAQNRADRRRRMGWYARPRS